MYLFFVRNHCMYRNGKSFDGSINFMNGEKSVTPSQSGRTDMVKNTSND